MLNDEHLDILIRIYNELLDVLESQLSDIGDFRIVVQDAVDDLIEIFDDLDIEY